MKQPAPAPVVKLTPTGYQELVNRLAELDRCIKEARASVSEESEYNYLVSIERNHEIITPVEQNEYVQFGNGVDVEIITSQKRSVRRFIIDGYRQDGVSYFTSDAPLVQAMIGAKARQGDEIKYDANGESKTVIVKKIVPPSQAEEFCRATTRRVATSVAP
jgi:transcription elongation GreA/GreB family factor